MSYTQILVQSTTNPADAAEIVAGIATAVQLIPLGGAAVAVAYTLRDLLLERDIDALVLLPITEGVDITDAQRCLKTV